MHHRRTITMSSEMQKLEQVVMHGTKDCTQNVAAQLLHSGAVRSGAMSILAVATLTCFQRRPKQV